MTHPDPTALRFEPLSEGDFDTIKQLGETIWRAHYPAIIGHAQIDYMLAGRYMPEKLKPYLDSTERWLELVRHNGEAVGYLSYALTTANGEMKLEQLYLLPALHGKGLGGQMLHH